MYTAAQPQAAIDQMQWLVCVFFCFFVFLNCILCVGKPEKNSLWDGMGCCQSRPGYFCVVQISLQLSFCGPHAGYCTLSGGPLLLGMWFFCSLHSVILQGHRFLSCPLPLLFLPNLAGRTGLRGLFESGACPDSYCLFFFFFLCLSLGPSPFCTVVFLYTSQSSYHRWLFSLLTDELAVLLPFPICDPPLPC